jgi:hypothetical protein
VKELKQIAIDDLRIDGGTQLRAEINQETVSDYAERIDELPPSIAFDDGSKIWLADGFHRMHGHMKAGKKKMLCEVRKGTQRDAILYALGANAAHGLRRTNADKRKAVLAMLADPEWSQWPQSKIAEACAVSREFVNRTVAEQRASCDRSQDAPATRTVERSGKTYPMDTGRIGKSKPKNGKSEKSNGRVTPDDDLIPNVNGNGNGKHAPPETTTEPVKDEPVKDEAGQEIKPGKLLDLWNRRQEITDLMAAISKIKSTVSKSCNEKDPLFTHV